MIDVTTWKATTAHTSRLGPPAARASRLITGNDAKTANDDAMPVTYTLFVPNRSLILAKKKIWKQPFMTP